MLVICNGAIKSGSTWLYNILANLASYSKPDDKYLTLRNERHPCIRPEMLAEFLATEDCAGKNFLSKNHLDKPAHRDLLMHNERVHVFDIERDPRDVVVSRYFHDCYRNNYKKDFKAFYWSIGRELVASLSAYHDLWRNAGPRAYVSSYEKLHNEFISEVSRIASVLSVDVTEDRLREIEQCTSLKSLRKDYSDEPRFEGANFFRKGKIGDWKNHLDEKMLADISRIRESGIGPLDYNRFRSKFVALMSR